MCVCGGNGSGWGEGPELAPACYPTQYFIYFHLGGPTKDEKTTHTTSDPEKVCPRPTGSGFGTRTWYLCTKSYHINKEET